jgi:LysR family transcriptional regulator, regulator for metE and metH
MPEQSPLELRHLRSLLAIAQCGKLSAAAERVCLTQSALSHQIKNLEVYYGAALFDRSKQGLRFTPVGERLLALARETVACLHQAERDVAALMGAACGQLRIVLECHTCFDWLMPVMDEFRHRWPEVEVDLVAGFHADPLALLTQQTADVVIGSRPTQHRSWHVAPLFRFEILAVLANEHPLRHKRYVSATDFQGETLITYPVPDARIDLIAQVLGPAGIKPHRRTAELTIAMVQLVASRRGVAALPNWGLKNYRDHHYIVAKRIGAAGLWGELHAVAAKSLAHKPYFIDFVTIVRDTCAQQLDGIELLG